MSCLWSYRLAGRDHSSMVAAPSEVVHRPQEDYKQIIHVRQLPNFCEHDEGSSESAGVTRPQISAQVRAILHPIELNSDILQPARCI